MAQGNGSSQGVGDISAKSIKSAEDKFFEQGQTAGPYGQDPNIDARGVAAQPARDLEP